MRGLAYLLAMMGPTMMIVVLACLTLDSGRVRERGEDWVDNRWSSGDGEREACASPSASTTRRIGDTASGERRDGGRID